MEKQTLGRIGEKCALEYILSKGWSVLATNYYLKFGEIDIISRDPHGVIVFIEVKSLLGLHPSGFRPEDNLSSWKLQKFRRMCKLFSAKHPHLFKEDSEWRMDLMAITFLEGKKALMHHY